jgi:hypothetical protein
MAEGPKTSGVKSSFQNSMFFADVELVVVLAIHEICVVELQ